ncbi:MAG: tRNA uridine-5-carboxymethylaminomethyl(34) synthesis GTPase MnmE [Steroidobacteraceae bacterium]
MSLDTIVAAATPPGRGGIGIVRLSGPGAPEIGTALAGPLPPPRHAALARFLDADQQTIDAGLVLYFPAPGSYTGEPVIELHGHGGPIVLEALITRAVELGARRAAPGEFTQRAFLNEKVDLAQAEAVADLIDAGSRAAARAAMRSLEGELSALAHGLTEAVVQLRMYVEAAIDFPEEEIDFLADRELAARLDAVRERFEVLEQSARRGRLLRDGMSVVIAGRPNAGKSSLLNRLAGYDAAIVTPVAGTTRDIVKERIHLDGMPLHILDTAGLREAGDAVEQEGIRRAHAEMARADRVLFVIDTVADPDGRAFLEERSRLPANVPVTLVFNKVDLACGIPLTDTVCGAPRVALSALTGEGLESLRSHLKSSMGYDALDAGAVSARARHLEALARARLHVDAAARELAGRRAGELVAEELREAQQALAQITGEFTSEDLLGRIFSSFCVGK